LEYWGDQIEEGENGRAYGMHGTEDKTMLWLVGRPERERLLGRDRQDDGIKIDLKEKGW